MNNCMCCHKSLKNSAKKYCSNKCQSDYSYTQYISNWKKGITNSSRGINAKNISGHIKRYITHKYDNKCARCRWNEMNISTNKTTLEIDHIDGNSENNIENNLTLLCPNCHSLTINYKNLNKGHGRLWRREKYVKID